MKKQELKVIKAFPHKNPKIESLHDRILNCIDEYAVHNETPGTFAEIIGTLECVKDHFMRER